MRIQVLDNGHGMTAEDLKLMGRKYWTSKCPPHLDGCLVNIGYRGEAVHAIRKSAKVVSVTSRTELGDTHSIQWKEGKRGEVARNDIRRSSVGTTVTVIQFLHQQPVRRRLVKPTVDAQV